MDYYNYGIPQINPNFVQPTQPTPQNPIQMPQQVQCPLDNRFAWVPSKDTARTMPMAPDKTILFLDENDSYAYFRKTDNTGKTIQFRVFQLVEEKEPEPTPSIPAQNDGVSRSEFETFSKNIDMSINELKDMILGMSNKQNYNKNYKDKAGDR